MRSQAHLIQTGLYFVEFIFSYAIMLMVMTFNVWLLVAVVLGSSMGFQLCRLLSRSHATPPAEVDENKNRQDSGEPDEKDEQGDYEKDRCVSKTISDKNQEKVTTETSKEEVEALMCSV